MMNKDIEITTKKNDNLFQFNLYDFLDALYAPYLYEYKEIDKANKSTEEKLVNPCKEVPLHNKQLYTICR